MVRLCKEQQGVTLTPSPQELPLAYCMFWPGFSLLWRVHVMSVILSHSIFADRWQKGVEGLFLTGLLP